MVAVPVAWAVLLLFHPTGEGDESDPVVRDQVSAWLVVHVGTLVFVPLELGDQVDEPARAVADPGRSPADATVGGAGIGDLDAQSRRGGTTR